MFKTTQFDFPVIVVGNLSVGGTGKTPQIEYLIRLLKDDYKVAVLSRGYKRSSKGFFLANKNTKVSEIGDEPFQYHSKFKNVYIAVDEDRVHGITELRNIGHPPQIVLLDDAYQHRKVKSNFNILLTPYNDLYIDDLVLPVGNLREGRSGANRASVVVVTKCPADLSEQEKVEIGKRLCLKPNQQLFFSKVAYADEIQNKKQTIPLSALKDYRILLITGIAKPKPLLEFLESEDLDFKHLKYSDHHNFSKIEIEDIKKEFDGITAEKKIILTTEKDYMRLKDRLDISYLEIKVDLFEKSNQFDLLVKDYVASK